MNATGNQSSRIASSANASASSNSASSAVPSGAASRPTMTISVTAIGVTLSEQQALYGQQKLVEDGITGSAQIRFSDYRNVPETGFDAVASIGLTEHIGAKNYPAYFEFVRTRLKPGARLF